MLIALGLLVVVAIGALSIVRRRFVRRRVFFAALLEQGRREVEHGGPQYRHDQRVRAIQQRLSRMFGASAHSVRTRHEIERAMRS